MGEIKMDGSWEWQEHLDTVGAIAVLHWHRLDWRLAADLGVMPAERRG